MIKNLVFDFGGVITITQHEEARNRFLQLGVRDIDKYLNPYTQIGFFGQLEEGKITAEEFVEKLSDLVGRHLTYNECQYAWLGYRKEVPKRNLDALRNLRLEGIHLILLSNTNPFMMAWALSKDFDGMGNSLTDYFDALYLSYREKLMKPSTAFFQLMLDREKIKPSETLFLDDGIKNVETAKSLGFFTLYPKNGEDWTGKVFDCLKV